MVATLAGTQLDMFSSIGAENGISIVENQEPLAPWVKFVGCDADITDEIYQFVNECFSSNLVVLDLETYGVIAPENGAYKKKTTNTRSWKKGTTNGLQDMALSPYYGDIRLFQISAVHQKDVLVVDLKTKWDKPLLSEKYKAFIEYLKFKTIEFAKAKKAFIGHNIGFDLLFLRVHWGVKMWISYDTMILSQLLTAGILTYRHGLKDCCERYLKIKDVDKTEQSSDFSLPLRNAQINYAALDISYTKRLFTHLAKEIKLAGLQTVAKIESEFTPALVEINHWGLPVDLVELERQIKWYQAKLLDIEMEFVKMHPGCNIKSSQQIAGIVQKINQQIEANKRSSGVDADDDDEDMDDLEIEQETHEVIDSVVKYGSSKSDLALLGDHRVVQLVVDFRTIAIYMNYCKQVRQEIIWVEGIPRISGGVRQLTRKGQGRTCSGNKRNPVKCQAANLQNPPSENKMPDSLVKMGCPIVRHIFKSPAGFNTIDQDLPAAHLAIAKFYSGEYASKTMKYIEENGLDNHAITMKSVFAVVEEYKQYRHLSVEDISNINGGHFEKVTCLDIETAKHYQKIFKPIRASCKNVVYSGLNCGSAPTLQNTIKTGQKRDVPLEICEAMVNAFPDVFPEIAKLRTSLWKQGNNKKIQIDGHWYGVLQTDFCPNKTEGYMRRSYVFCKNSGDGRPYMPQGAIANVWLKTESDIMKSGIAKVYQEAVFTDKYDLRLGLICHDEIVATCTQQQALDCAEIVKNSMLAAMKRFTGNGVMVYEDMEKSAESLIMGGWDH
ncbi:DNA polymerase A [Nodularia phage vB_NspS-kac65v151]|uniref:DNA polymerase A n=1 Tax=Nodularia phage vB_NspS-kac65v151 TaxID=2557579 RepID=A0A482MHF6_9CAUD|nr:DNA polymerase A [Nodularia phage vB_NspS-kac65v151]QBQ73099.1 DNA polymerase A [Nodularia phage vB_NspS-kac65v151]